MNSATSSTPRTRRDRISSERKSLSLALAAFSSNQVKKLTAESKKFTSSEKKKPSFYVLRRLTLRTMAQ